MIKSPTDLVWQEGPLPDVNDVPDDAYILAWVRGSAITWVRGSAITFFTLTPRHETNLSRFGPRVASHWVDPTAGYFNNTSNVKYWAIISGTTLNDINICSVIK